jgi:hypothetical protein
MGKSSVANCEAFELLTIHIERKVPLIMSNINDWTATGLLELRMCNIKPSLFILPSTILGTWGRTKRDGTAQANKTELEYIGRFPYKPTRLNLETS